jgi:hypothetical protein
MNYDALPMGARALAIVVAAVLVAGAFAPLMGMAAVIMS